MENLRLVIGEIKVADVRAQVALFLFSDFENFAIFKPHEHHDNTVHLMADEVSVRETFGFGTLEYPISEG